MRPRTLIVLFVLVAGLAGFIWWVEADLPGTDERAELALKLLVFDREEITRFEVDRDGERVVFERTPQGAWEIVEPVSAWADSGAVESLLDELEALEKERTFAEGQAAALGLAPPRAVLSLRSEQQELRLYVGSAVPASESMIAAIHPTGPFHVVARAVWTAMDRTAESWRERTVFSGQRAAIERLVIARDGERLSLASKDGEFMLEEPLADRADEGTVSRLLDALVELEVSEFVDEGEPLAEHAVFAPDPPALEVVLRGAETPWRLELGGVVEAEGAQPETDDAGLIYVRADGRLYVVPDSLSATLALPTQEWRSLEWSGHQVHEMDRLEIHDAEGTTVLENNAGDWRRDGARVEHGAVSDLLYAIAGTKAEALDAEGAVVGAPLLRATVNAGQSQQVLEIFAATGDSYPATVSDRNSVLWLGGDRVRSIVSNVAKVRAAPPLPDDEVGDEDGAGSPTAATAAAAPE